MATKKPTARTVDNPSSHVDKSTGKSKKRGPLADHPEWRGRGPKKGAPNAGRPPDAWKALCRELASSPELIEKAKLVLQVPNHPAWLGAWKFLTEQGYGKAAQPVQHDGAINLRVTFE